MNLKKTMVLGAVAALGVSSAAMAQDITFNLPDFTVSADSSGPLNDFTFNYSGYLEGFSFSGDASGVSGNFTYASDTRLRVYLNGVEVGHIGGFTSAGAPWDFQGIQSDNDGFYSHGPDMSLMNGSGDWEFVFTNGWHSASSADITWSNGQLTLHNIPAPGALALLGLAGLVGVRRHRN